MSNLQKISIVLGTIVSGYFIYNNILNDFDLNENDRQRIRTIAGREEQKEKDPEGVFL